MGRPRRPCVRCGRAAAGGQPASPPELFPLSAALAALGSAEAHDGSAPFFLVIDVVVLVSAAAPTAGSANPSRGRPGGAVAAAAAAAANAAATPAAGAAARTARAAGGERPAAGPDGSVRAGGRRRVAAQRTHRAHLLLPAAARPAAGLGLLLALARVPLLPGAVAPAPPLPPRLARGAAAPGVPHAQVRLVRAGAAR